jgi:HSP20 family protein
VKVTIEDDLLSIAGEKKVEHIDDKTHFSKRSYGSFTRSFTLPTQFRGDKVEAKFDNGLLTIVVPKAEETKLRKVTIA